MSYQIFFKAYTYKKFSLISQSVIFDIYEEVTLIKTCSAYTFKTTVAVTVLFVLYFSKDVDFISLTSVI